MGNTPSKNDPLPRTSSVASTGGGAASGTAVGEVDSEDIAPPLSKHSTSGAIAINNNINKNDRNQKVDIKQKFHKSNNKFIDNKSSNSNNKSINNINNNNKSINNINNNIIDINNIVTDKSLSNKFDSKFYKHEKLSDSQSNSDNNKSNYNNRKLGTNNNTNHKSDEFQNFDLEIGASMAHLLNTSNNYSSSVDTDSSSSPVSTTIQDEISSCSLVGNSPGNKFLFRENLIDDIKMDSIAELSIESTPESNNKYIEKSKISKISKISSSDSSLSSSPPLIPANKKIDIDIDLIISKLIDIGTKKPPSQSQMRRGKDKLPLSYSDLKYIISKSRQIFLEQPTLLNLSPSVKIVGDIHGQFHDLIRIFKSCGYPPYTNYLFLGDYIDRGYKSLETILLLLCYKIKYPENFFMLRGNHESANITKIYGFYDECKRRLAPIGNPHKLWKNFVDVFNTLPIAATINNKILCIHGGLSPDLHDLKQIEHIKRPTDIPDKGLLADLLWSDPDASIKNFSVTNWPKNDRGVSYCFGKKHVDYFCNKFKLDLIVRGHMVVEDGYEFFNKRKLVTIFSAPNYCGEFDNFGAVMSVDKSLCCSFDLIKPNGR